MVKFTPKLSCSHNFIFAFSYVIRFWEFKTQMLASFVAGNFKMLINYHLFFLQPHFLSRELTLFVSTILKLWIFEFVKRRMRILPINSLNFSKSFILFCIFSLWKNFTFSKVGSKTKSQQFLIKVANCELHSSKNILIIFYRVKT